MMIFTRGLQRLFVCAGIGAVSACGGGGDDSATPVDAMNHTMAVSALARWTAGKAVEVGDPTVATYKAGIADNGAVIATFVKNNGTRNVLYAVRGVPGAASIAPTWGAPVAIDSAAGVAVGPYPDSGTGSWNIALAVAPGGRAFATWITRRACTAATYNTSPLVQCEYLYGAAFDGSNWGSAELISDTPRSWGTPIPRINNTGDIAVLFDGYDRPGTGFQHKAVVASRLQGQVGFAKALLSSWTLNALVPLNTRVDMQLDNSRNITVAGHISQNSTYDIVAYRGAVASAFRAQELIDTLPASATFLGLAMGPGGRSFVRWFQNDGSGNKVWAAATTSHTAAWTSKNLGVAFNVGFNGRLQALSSGIADLYYDNCTRYRWLPATATWTAIETLPTGCSAWNNASGHATNTNGDQLWVANNGRWSSFDNGLSQIIKPLAAATSTAATDYMLGFPLDILTTGKLYGSNMSSATVLLTPGGLGALVTLGNLDTLPTAAVKAGVGRSAVYNLWGWYLK